MATKKVENERPLFTVIIPTKDRAEYLHHTLRTCMMQEYERLEIVVADDASTDHSREVIEQAAQRDPRIRCLTTATPLGMRDNFERALAQANPGFVIALGGDDGLLPGGIEGMHAALSATGTNLLTWPTPIYSYPSVRGANGQLAVYLRGGMRLVDSHEFLNRQARNLHYLSDLECPMFYVKGVVATSLIDRVRSRSPDRRFYLSPTPDGYSGIVLAGEVSTFAFSGRPFSIHGLSPSSQGLAYLSDEAKAQKRSEEFYQSVSSTPMHRDLASLPYSPLITLMTADYLLTAADLPGWGGRFAPIDYEHLLRKSIGELANGLYRDERICRELNILSKIAARHGLSAFFRAEVRKTSRRRQRSPFEGTGVNTGGVLVDGKAFGIRNVFDAAYAAHTVYHTYLEARPSSLVRTLARSLLYRYRTVGGQRSFPPESEWI